MLRAARKIIETLHENGYQAFLVGGCVRDLLLGREPKDYDVTTDATPEQVMGIFPKTVPVGAAFGVVVVVEDGCQIEVATFRADGDYSDARRPDTVSYSQTAREDVVRRDFTINGLLLMPTLSIPHPKALLDKLEGIVAADSANNEVTWTLRNGNECLVDYVGGQEDIERRVIRCIGDPVARFTEDALRMLRAVRFAAQLGFEIDPQTEAAIRARAQTITKVSRERIAAELFKLVAAPYPVKGLVPLVTTGLSDFILPSLGDIETTLRRFALFPTSDPLKGMAMLLAEMDQEIAENRCCELKLSNEQKDVLVGALRGGGKIHVLDALTLAELKKLARRPGIQIAVDLFEQEVAMGRDRMSEGYAEAIRKLRTFTRQDLHPTPLVTGLDLIEMGLIPGPLFTEILGAMETEQLNGTITDRETALKAVRTHVVKRGDWRN